MVRSPRPSVLVGRIRALVFDLDGTLYAQRPVRVRMAAKLVLAHWASPRAGLSAVRALRAYRAAQEVLRRGGPDATGEPLAIAQLNVAAAMSGEDPSRIAECVARWMLREPLPLLARAATPGLVPLLEWAVAEGVAVGVVSDYPATEKLQALGVSHFVNTVVTAQDADVQHFKPHPRGLVTALQRLKVTPDQAVYFGDRPEVDGIAADRAGVPCVLLGRPRRTRPWPAIRDFEEALTLLRG